MASTTEHGVGGDAQALRGPHSGVDVPLRTLPNSRMATAVALPQPERAIGQSWPPYAEVSDAGHHTSAVVVLPWPLVNRATVTSAEQVSCMC